MATSTIDQEQLVSRIVEIYKQAVDEARLNIKSLPPHRRQAVTDAILTAAKIALRDGMNQQAQASLAEPSAE